VDERGGVAPRGDDAPPFGRSWTLLYVIVVVNLALWIAALAVFTGAYR